MKPVSGSLIYGLNRLNIDVGDDQIVCTEVEFVSNLVVFINSKNGSSNDFSRVSVEIVKANGSNSSTNSKRELKTT